MKSLEATIAEALSARVQWKSYYRAVRVLARMRQIKPLLFLQFSSVWWHGHYKHEQWLGAQGLPFHQRKLLRPARRLP